MLSTIKTHAPPLHYGDEHRVAVDRQQKIHQFPPGTITRELEARGRKLWWDAKLRFLYHFYHFRSLRRVLNITLKLVEGWGVSK